MTTPFTRKTPPMPSCRVCGRPAEETRIRDKVVHRPWCSDACFYAENPAERPASDVPPDMPVLSWAQRRELNWMTLIPPRQRDYDFSKLKPKAQQAGRDFASYDGERSILVTGASTAGKTYVAYRLARLAYMLGKRVFCVTADKARADWLKEGGGERYLEKLKTVPLLLMDDLGMESTSPGWVSAVYEVFNRRETEGLPFIVTVNRVRGYYREHYSVALMERLWRDTVEVIEL